MLGAAGKGVIEALIASETSPEKLSWKVRGKLRKKEKGVTESLKGCFNEFQRDLLCRPYKHYRFLTGEIGDFEKTIAGRMTPYAEQVGAFRRDSGRGSLGGLASDRRARVDMTVFPDADHCASWAGLVPGENESAGHTKSTRCRKGNRALRRVLTQAAWASSRCKHGYLRASFYRTKARRGWQAIPLAVGLVLGASPTPKPCLLGFPMPTSSRLVFPHSLISESVTSRTAVYEPVLTVGWQGSMGDRRPYADHPRISALRDRHSRGRKRGNFNS